MKKIYLAPELEVYKVELTGIMAASPGLGDGSTDTMYSKYSIFDIAEDDENENDNENEN